MSTQERAHPHIPGIEFQKYHWGYTTTAAAAAAATVGAREEEPAEASARKPSLGFNPKENARRRNAATAAAATMFVQ